MGYQTKNDILAKWDTPERRQEAKEIGAIRKDITTAYKYLTDALARYRKDKTKAKSKKAAQENPGAELEGYTSLEQIRDDYGWEIITEEKMYRLMELWELRETQAKKDTVYHDRVTDMLEKAAAALGEEYQDKLFDYEQRQAAIEREAEAVARENNERTWQREHGQRL